MQNVQKSNKSGAIKTEYKKIDIGNKNLENQNRNICYYSLSKTEVLKKFDTNDTSGLSSLEVKKRMKTYGLNKLDEAKKKSVILKFLEQFSDFMVIILLIAAAVSFVTAVIQGSKSEFLDPIIILVIVVINAIVGVIQEFKAEKSIAALKKLTASETVALRDGRKSKILADDLVPGDVIILESGNSVPADARILDNISVETDESALTGESTPVLKDETFVCPPQTALGDRKNMIYMTSTVTSGKCTAVVVNTGMSTEVGKIAKILTEEEDLSTPLQERLSKTGKILGITALTVCAVIFVLGMIQKVPVLEMFMLSISLAVAAMPEGLPAVVTIVLAVGIQRMAKSNAIIRRLSAVETLGSATVICSDKTGTLTQNKMTVVEIYTPDCRYSEADSKNIKDVKNIHSIKNLLLLSVLCNNSAMTSNKSKNNSNEYIGDPTETAFCYVGEKFDINKSTEEIRYPRQLEIPFDSIRKTMTTVNKFSGISRVITKGAPDILINKCTHYIQNDRIEPLTKSKIAEITEINEKMAGNALRVIAVAYRDIPEILSLNNLNRSKSLENNLIFCGLIGMIDPPRQEVFKAIQICRTAGIKPVMITGDHKITAIAIAKKIGIYNNGAGDKVATGAELDAISEEDLLENIHSYSVFARVSPEHKVRIVKAFKARGNVVAMTGDGVNDAPSLKIADMGCAMGENGTDVARNSADMILVDDNFSTIVEAVRQGRGIYDNIKKAVHFLLSSNFGEIMTIFAAFLLRLPSPLIAIHLLWVNFVTDSLPALALSEEPPSDEVMKRPPINSKRSLFAGGLGLKIIFEGLMIGSLTLCAFVIGMKFFDNGSDTPVYARTMAFMTLSVSQLVHAFNMRSNKSVFKIGLLSNIYMNFSFIICLIMQVSVVVIKPLADIFKTENLPASAWIIVALLSVAPLVIIELQKLVTKE
ncbi:MAG: calcium-translocating P-type ATPase, PMCA-type [Oscillospiraceae bacterium]|nr:calcium-translocating P-type ATPase, PMCA-type [Oscillospiraceae bacterium]